MVETNVLKNCKLFTQFVQPTTQRDFGGSVVETSPPMIAIHFPLPEIVSICYECGPSKQCNFSLRSLL